MFAIKPYRRLRAAAYAQKWALGRNPLFQDFAGCGGDCTNFISQSVFAGCCTMNPLPTFGWYFRAPGDYAPAWTGVPYFRNFLLSNMECGPFGEEVPPTGAELGDVVQLGGEDGTFYHSLIITGVRGGAFLVCAHNNDALDRPLTSYSAPRIRYLHIAGVRIRVPEQDCCYEGLFAGTSLFPTAEQRAALSCTASPVSETFPPEEFREGDGMEEEFSDGDGMTENLPDGDGTQEDGAAVPVPLREETPPMLL